MKEVDNKDLPAVPGGTLPDQSGRIGTCFPPFPVPVETEPFGPVPLPPTFNTKF